MVIVFSGVVREAPAYARTCISRYQGEITGTGRLAAEFQTLGSSRGIIVIWYCPQSRWAPRPRRGRIGALTRAQSRGFCVITGPTRPAARTFPVLGREFACGCDRPVGQCSCVLSLASRGVEWRARVGGVESCRAVGGQGESAREDLACVVTAGSGPLRASATRPYRRARHGQGSVGGAR